MTEKRRRVELMIETDEVIVVRACRGVSARCVQCGGDVILVTVDHAAAVAGVSARAIFRRVEAGTIHFQEASDGRLLICLSSL